MLQSYVNNIEYVDTERMDGWHEVIHVEIQKILWDLIDEQLKNDLELDYLQVFELKAKHGEQHVIHRQEVPERIVRWIFRLKHTTTIDRTICCMDNDEYQMMCCQVITEW